MRRGCSGVTASPRDEVERVARESAGRLVARLARHSRNLERAQDAVSEALLAALQTWPEEGVPDRPEAWLATVAQRKLVGTWRRADVRRRKAAAIRDLQSIALERSGRGAWPDERLPLLFVCAHSAIDPPIRAPLMLQAVLGLTADAIGPLVGSPSKTIGQRLWRAKTKIRDAGIPFAVPEGRQLAERVNAVLDAVYGLYAAGWNDRSKGALAEEAVWLARVVAELLPDEPEAHGLFALLRYVDARRAAGRSTHGAYVPLTEQDPETWNASAIEEADGALQLAQTKRVFGPFQLEAAIQSALVHGVRAGRVDHEAILSLYDGWLSLAPTLGGQVGRAAALAEVQGPEAGLAELDAMVGVDSFQPWWAVRADLLRRLDRPEADDMYARAIALTQDEALRAWLQQQRRAVRSPTDTETVQGPRP